MTNLATLLVNSAAVHDAHIAVRHDDTALTYEQLDGASARLAGVLRDRGVRPGDVVTMTMPNVPLFPVVYYGILRAGGVVVPMNPLLKAREAAFVLRDSGARPALAHPMCAEEVGPLSRTPASAPRTAVWSSNASPIAASVGPALRIEATLPMVVRRTVGPVASKVPTPNAAAASRNPASREREPKRSTTARQLPSSMPASMIRKVMLETAAAMGCHDWAVGVA
ncbi:AMP-binding protein [Streptomyces sp. NPDC052107]|uniref:AMP-binding protein n=1 Tax=Streptomyces sp. NPDC052107 TaxID=3155632 RepID=UPI00342D7A09